VGEKMTNAQKAWIVITVVVLLVVGLVVFVPQLRCAATGGHYGPGLFSELTGEPGPQICRH
jgi:hypothetical protein